MANPILPNGVASPQSIYEQYSVSATNQSRAIGHHRIGTKAYLPDGRVFYYSSNGTTALTVGSLLIGSALSRSGNHDKITLTDSSGNFAAGNTSCQLDNTDLDTSDIITDEYADGYLGFEQPDGAAAGHIYRIRSHTEGDASASTGGATFLLFDEIAVSADSSDEITLCRNPNDRVVTSTTAEEELAVGVSPLAITGSTALATDVTTAVADTTTYFFWAQTWGPAMVEVDDTTVALGVAATSGDAVDRIEAAQTGTFDATMGTVAGMQAAVVAVGLVPAVDEAGDFAMVDLRIRP